MVQCLDGVRQLLAVLLKCCDVELKQTRGLDDPQVLARETVFSVSEVEALYELFKKISSAVIDDGLINKEEFQLALFKTSKKESLFADRVSLHLLCFHSGYMISNNKASLRDKRYVAMELLLLCYFHLGCTLTSYVMVKQMVVATLAESGMNLSDDIVRA
ncbi:hypothetical protein PR202_ga11975 [Eleusine coracana subsp. coracana]|uniref:Calcineurin B-like protein n=1 Tax=Eleusine coracana subsp. coracana TaxID=191504 RepID=A0AAV5CB00_ELECO|nr:hypothetical protein PR202_ga11975 [Eleusine coracana subsp. coracana]